MQTRGQRVLSSLVAVTAAILAVGPTQAQVGYTYQGRLTQNGAVFDNNTQVLTFELFAASSGGTALSVNTVSVEVNDSLFTAQLTFPAALFDGSDRWLQIRVGQPTDPPLTPRQKVAAAPYALHTRGLFVDANGNVGTGAAVTPAAEFDVRDPSGAANERSRIRAANGTGDTWVMLWSGHSDGANDPAIIWSDDVAGDDLRFMHTNTTGNGGAELMRITGAGSVGIGTTAPTSQLDVRGATGPLITGTLNLDLSFADLFKVSNSATSASFLVDNRGAVSINSRNVIDFGLTVNAATSTVGAMRILGASGVPLLKAQVGASTSSLMVLDSGVGMGTDTPAARLHVSNGSAGVAPTGSAALVVEDNSTAYINLLTPATSNSGVVFGSPTNNADASLLYNVGSDRRLRFRTGGNADRMTVDAVGNVGIGTTNPGFPLSFPNTLGDKISLYGQSGPHYGFGVQGSLLQIYGSVLSSNIAFGYGESSAFTEVMRIQGSGNVGIGTIAPLGKAHIASADLSIPAAAIAGDTAILESTDALLGLVSDGVGGYGSGIAFREIAAGALVDTWGIVRRTSTAPNPSLRFTYGTAAGPGAGATLMLLTPEGNLGIGPAPAAKLHVGGDIKLGGPTGELFAPGGVENLRMMRGIIETTGAIVEGAGFTAARLAAGHYRITYSTAFADQPSLTANAVQTNAPPEIATISLSNASLAEVKIWTTAGVLTDSAFQFIVVGAR